MGLAGSIAFATPALAVNRAVEVWHVQSTPSPGGSAVLWAIDCLTTTNCHAIGSFTGRDGATRPFGEVWNGQRWSSQAAAPLKGSNNASLYSISCPETATCIAVGTALAGGQQQAIAERWNGRAWSALPAIERPGSALESVACSSAIRCVAVGVEAAGPSNVPLSEIWNGTRWNLVGAPAARWSLNSALYGISCPSARLCLAVGQYQDAHYRTHALVEQWNGTAWSVRSGQDVPDQGDLLTSVACSSTRYCLAVGSAAGDSGKTVAISEAWNGSAWALTPRLPLDPGKAGETSPLSVSCGAGRSCVFVGEVAAGGREEPIAEAWDGRVWTLQSVVGPSTSLSYLDGVSCPSTSACSAVGSNGGGALGAGYGSS
jgi:hypothetical protein